jgi:LysR family transcriptional regulator for bpeEF and oprC
VIRGGDIHDESLVARRLGDFRMLTYAAPSYLAKHGEPKNLEDLERHQMIAFASPKTGKVFPLIYEKDDVQTIVQGIQRISINDADSCAAAACSGIGLVQLPAFIAHEYVDSGQLVAIMNDYPSELVPIWILYPPNRHLSTKVRAFAEWAAELFAKTKFG